jgi:hypothetical protein
LRDCTLLIIANKQDLPNAMSPQEVADKMRFNDIKLKQKHILGAVATTGQGLNEGLEWITNVLTKQDWKNNIVAPLVETKEDAKVLANVFSESSFSAYLKLYSDKFFGIFKIPNS